MLSKNKLLLALAIIQILFFAGWYLIENKKLNKPSSKTFKVKALNYYSDYPTNKNLNLQYEFSYLKKSRYKINQSKTNINQIYAVLKKKDSRYILDYFSNEIPMIKDDQVVLKGTFNKNSNIIEYGIENHPISKDLNDPKIYYNIEVTITTEDNLIPKIDSLTINGNELK